VKRGKKPTELKAKIKGNGQRHPDHTAVLLRLMKIKGQIDGIEKMIRDRRYCVDILTQLKASSSALRSVEAVILKKHLRGCVQDAISLKDQDQIEKKIEEMVKLSVGS
jgi:DNA-binding FrmR family transcriptional regulator